MGAPKSKSSEHKRHYCPTCAKPAPLFMRMPGKKMIGKCESGHEFRLSKLIRK